MTTRICSRFAVRSVEAALAAASDHPGAQFEKLRHNSRRPQGGGYSRRTV